MKNTCIITINYKSCEQTRNCIKSIKSVIESKTYLIDNSVNIDELFFFEKHFKKDPSICLIINKKNTGFAYAVNQGLHMAIEAGYDKFILLNNDTVVYPNFGNKIKEALEKYPGKLIAPLIKWNGAICGGRYYHKYFGLITDKKIYFKSGWVFYVTGCCLAFDKSIIDKIGFFNEKYFMYGEDVEYCYTAQKNGIPLILLDEILLEHKGSHSARIASFFYEYHINRSHFLLCFSLFDQSVKKTISLIGKTFFLSVRALLRSIKYRKISPIIGFLLAPLPLKIRPHGK
jgi:N-acetylglucosaminyl-diphospho-decaprenol L-rhamnosyltransferase